MIKTHNASPPPPPQRHYKSKQHLFIQIHQLVIIQPILGETAADANHLGAQLVTAAEILRENGAHRVLCFLYCLKAAQVSLTLVHAQGEGHHLVDQGLVASRHGAQDLVNTGASIQKNCLHISSKIRRFVMIIDLNI